MSYPINYDPEGLAKGHLANAQQYLADSHYHQALVEIAKAVAPLKHLRYQERAKARAFNERFRPRYKHGQLSSNWQQARHLADTSTLDNKSILCGEPSYDAYDKPYRVKSHHCEACLTEAHRRFKEEQ